MTAKSTNVKNCPKKNQNKWKNNKPNNNPLWHGKSRDSLLSHSVNLGVAAKKLYKQKVSWMMNRINLFWAADWSWSGEI